jgi:hypothetical protein
MLDLVRVGPADLDGAADLFRTFDEEAASRYSGRNASLTRSKKLRLSMISPPASS